MKFALLYQYDPSKTGPSPAEISDWLAFDAQVRDAGIFVYESGFHAADHARTVSLRDGAASVTDGVGQGDGEVSAGVYVIDVDDAEAATAWAKKVPTASYGSVAVRQVVEYAG